MSSNSICHSLGNSTTFLAGTASSTVAVLLGGDNAAARRYRLVVLSGGAHFRFGTSAAAAVTTDPMITTTPEYIFTPANGTVAPTHIAAIAANATTAHFNVSVVDP